MRWGRTSCGGDAQVLYTGEYLFKEYFTIYSCASCCSIGSIIFVDNLKWTSFWVESPRISNHWVESPRISNHHDWSTKDEVVVK